MIFTRLILLLGILSITSSQAVKPDSVYIPITDSITIVDSTKYYLQGAATYKKLHETLGVIRKVNSKAIDREISRLKSRKPDTVWIMVESSAASSENGTEYDYGGVVHDTIYRTDTLERRFLGGYKKKRGKE